MPAFGKKVKEESINDKMVRLFKEGKTVSQISQELEVKADVITNVIRRRCGEDSIPETVIRSKNSMPHPTEDQPLKADMPSFEVERPAAEPVEEQEEIPTEGLSKLERMMLEKEKKKQEAAKAEAESVAEQEPAQVEMEAVSMEGISTDNLNLYDEPVAEPAPEPVEEAEMDGISAADIPVLDEAEPIEEQPVAAFTSEPVAESVSEPVAAAFEMPMGASGSAFDKMKAFAHAQVEANNAKLAELEAKLSGVEGEYTAQLEEAQKAVEESKVTYEEVITRSDEVNERRMAAQAEHRTALARAEEDYRKKLAELDEEYNNATAHANKVLVDKEVEINAAIDAVEAEKETAKNNFLSNQAAVTDIKDKIANEVDSVKAQIESLKEENKGYESFL